MIVTRHPGKLDDGTRNRHENTAADITHCNVLQYINFSMRKRVSNTLNNINNEEE